MKFERQLDIAICRGHISRCSSNTIRVPAICCYAEVLPCTGISHTRSFARAMYRHGYRYHRAHDVWRRNATMAARNSARRQRQRMRSDCCRQLQLPALPALE